MSNQPVLDLLQRAFLAEKERRFTDAQDSYRLAIDAAGESPLGCDARLRLARVLATVSPANGNQVEALLGKVIALAERRGAARQQAMAMHQLAALYRTQRRLDEAESLLERSPAVAMRYDAPGPELAQWFHYRGLIASARGSLANAERLCLRSHQLYRELHDEQGLAEICNSLAGILLERGKTKQAALFARQSLDLKRQLKDRYGLAISHGTLGRIRIMQGDYLDAEKELTECVRGFEELGDPQGLAPGYNGLGEVYLALRKWDAAVSRFSSGLGVEGGALNHLYAIVGLSRAHLGANRVNEAGKGLALLLGCDDTLAGPRDAHADGIRGAIARRQGKFDEAEQYLEKAIAALDARERPLQTIPWRYELRDLYQETNRTSQAIEVMASVLDLLAEAGSAQGVLEVEEWIREVDQPSLVRLTISRHLPDHLLDSLLQGQLAALPPRRQPVVVFFTDLRDYTPLTERLPAEDVVEILNEWFVEVTRAIRRHGGVVNQFIGDAIMALFGIPEPRRDAASSAIRAALDVRDALAAFNLRRQALGLQTIRIGIGINAGEAVVGFVGSHLRQTYTAVGVTVNAAARLEALTKEVGQDIVISEECENLQAADPVAETTFLGEHALKGLEKPMRVFAVAGRWQRPPAAR